MGLRGQRKRLVARMLDRAIYGGLIFGGGVLLLALCDVRLGVAGQQRFSDRLGCIFGLDPLLELSNRYWRNCAKPLHSLAIRESALVDALSLAQCREAQHDLMLVEFATSKVFLVDDEYLVALQVFTQVNVDVIAVGSLGTLQISIRSWHGDAPRLAVRVGAGAFAALRVLDGDV